MAIVSIDEIGQQRSSSHDRMGRKYKRVFRVVTNDPRDGSARVRVSLGILLFSKYEIGDRYTDSWADWDDWAFCTNISAEVESQADDSASWICTADYGPPELLNQNQPAGGTPLDATPTIEWDYAKNTVNRNWDVTGNPITTTIGLPFEGGVEFDEYYMILKFGRAEKKFNPLMALYYAGAINSDTFLGFDPCTVKCETIQSKAEYNVDIGWYYRTNYEFHFKNPWDIPPITPVDPGEDDQDRTIYYNSWRLWILNASTKVLAPGKTAPTPPVFEIPPQPFQKPPTPTPPAAGTCPDPTTPPDTWRPALDNHGKEYSHPVPISLDGHCVLTQPPFQFLQVRRSPELPFSVFNISVADVGQ